jgi:iron(III) transport system permease protein
VLAFLLLFLVLPVGRVFSPPSSRPTARPRWATSAPSSARGDEGVLLQQPDRGAAASLFAALIAVPLAYLTVRFEFRGALLIQTLGVLPLIMPPFVGAVALQLIFGRSGSVNLLLNDWFGFTRAHHGRAERRDLRREHPLLPVHPDEPDVALRNIDGAMEEAALNLGCRGWRLFWRVIFPLACRASWPARRWCS